ncbi:hypothetical protein PanWU01x14_338720 [Parasponia andersonii]|uniref:Uncharacterized protein n=1 Tax=Parasponia andersonii TaxID=3476 RepID=A0A2P5AF12_PARAD|nr:hypothetical protein PanWU01x14_338720 [Parasponia andersonii]
MSRPGMNLELSSLLLHVSDAMPCYCHCCYLYYMLRSFAFIPLLRLGSIYMALRVHRIRVAIVPCDGSLLPQVATHKLK